MCRYDCSCIVVVHPQPLRSNYGHSYTDQRWTWSLKDRSFLCMFFFFHISTFLSNRRIVKNTARHVYNSIMFIVVVLLWLDTNNLVSLLVTLRGAYGQRRSRSVLLKSSLEIGLSLRGRCECIGANLLVSKVFWRLQILVSGVLGDGNRRGWTEAKENMRGPTVQEEINASGRVRWYHLHVLRCSGIRIVFVFVIARMYV
jgi:hypothetical protein